MRRRLPFLFWALPSYPEGVDLTPPNDRLDKHATQSRHSIRLQRYWWAARAIEDEATRIGRAIIIADIGCERGWLKRFVSTKVRARWVGLDGNLSHPSLAASNYDETIQADFNQRLPLPDGFADVVVSLHVFEHLVDPHATTREIARILRDDGLFLVGTPVGSSPIAAIRTKLLRHRQLAGKNRQWGHLRKFSPALWGRICESARLRLEFLTGSHLFRISGFTAENWRWWIRLNQLWGALFPSLGQEIYLAARKSAQEQDSRLSVRQRLWFRFDWAFPVIALVCLGMLFWSYIFVAHHPLADEIANHQDGNDVFVSCALAELHQPDAIGNVESANAIGSLSQLFETHRRDGRDLHLIIRSDHVHHYVAETTRLPLHVADVWTDRGRTYLVLSQESHHVPLEVWTRREHEDT